MYLCGIFTANAQRSLERADSLFAAGNYAQAGLHYEFAAYSNNDPEIKTIAILGRVQALKQTGDYLRAIRLIERTSIFGTPDDYKPELIYEAVLLNYLQGYYQESVARYKMGKAILENSPREKVTQKIIALAYLKSDKQQQAETSGLKYIESAFEDPAKRDSLRKVYQSFFNREPIRKKDSRTARLLSAFIPGSGQVYSGHTGNGIISFGFHTLTLGFAAYAVFQGYYFTAWLAGMGILQKFYLGGIRNAEQFAIQKNRDLENEFLLPVEEFLLSI